MDGSEELRSKIEQAKSELAATREAIVVRAESLKKAKNEREAANVEACRLREKRKADEAKCKKVE